jgi:hypothetical protein
LGSQGAYFEDLLVFKGKGLVKLDAESLKSVYFRGEAVYHLLHSDGVHFFSGTLKLVLV